MHVEAPVQSSPPVHRPSVVICRRMVTIVSAERYRADSEVVVC